MKMFYAWYARALVAIWLPRRIHALHISCHRFFAMLRSMSLSSLIVLNRGNWPVFFNPMRVSTCPCLGDLKVVPLSGVLLWSPWPEAFRSILLLSLGFFLKDGCPNKPHKIPLYSFECKHTFKDVLSTGYVNVNADTWFWWIPSLIVARSWDSTWCWSTLTSLDGCKACRPR